MFPELHLINPMLQVSGAEMRTVHLYRLLEAHAPVKVWCHRRAPLELHREVPMQPVSVLRGRFPKDGVFVVMGAYFPWFLRPWFVLTRPARTILLYNLHDPDDLRETRRLVSRGGRRPVEMVFASEALQREAGIGGFVENSPIDLTRYTPSALREAGSDRFVVGRCSRDIDFKYAEGDPVVFRRLAEHGCTVRLVGGTCLEPVLGAVPGIELLPALPQSAVPAFLAGLDCFVYRTSARYQEAYGRVIAEAMACGVPVIVESRVGASKHVEHGVNGFIADTDEDVLVAVSRLRSDRALRASMSAAARATIAAVHTEETQRRVLDFYLRPLGAGATPVHAAA